MTLQNLIGTNLQGAGGISTGQNKTKKNYIALAIVNKGELPAIGELYTGTGGIITGTIAVSGLSISRICQDLLLANKARWLPNGCVTGSKDETVNILEGQIYGNEVTEAPTGEVTEMFHFIFKNYYQNVSGLNSIRSRPREFDFVVFTENTAEIYRRDDHSATVVKIADTADGTNTNSRNGTIDFAARGFDGQIVPLEGVYLQLLGEVSNAFYNLTDGAIVNLTKGTCSGAYVRFTRTTTNTISTLQPTVSFTAGCQTFYLYRLVDGVFQPSTGMTYASINAVTGLVTFPAAHAVGATRYVIQVQNEVGAHAEYYLEVNIA